MIEMPAIVICDLRPHTRSGFEGDNPVAGNIDIEFLIEHNRRLIELVLRPELSRGQRVMNRGHRLAFQDVAGT